MSNKKQNPQVPPAIGTGLYIDTYVSHMKSLGMPVYTPIQYSADSVSVVSNGTDAITVSDTMQDAMDILSRKVEELSNHDIGPAERDLKTLYILGMVTMDEREHLTEMLRAKDEESVELAITLIESKADMSNAVMRKLIELK